MNRLKYVLGIPRRVSSNSTIITRCNHQEDVCKKRTSKFHLLKPTESSSHRTKKLHDCKYSFNASLHKGGVSCWQQRYRVKRSTLEKKFSLEATRKHPRRYSSGQLTKLNNPRRHNGQKSQSTINRTKASEDVRTYSTTLATMLHEKEPRSYAQLIANYSETIRIPHSTGMFRDTMTSSIDNRTRRNPFSTLSAIQLRGYRKDIEDTARSTPYRIYPSDYYERGIRQSGGSSRNMRFNFQDNENLGESTRDNYEFGGNLRSLERKNSSYATMIAKYSDNLEIGVNQQVRYDSLVSKRNVSTNRFEKSASMLLDGNVFGKTADSMPYEKNYISFGRQRNSGKESRETEMSKRGDWLRKVEQAMKDLKRVAGRENSDINNNLKSEEKLMQSSASNRADWLDRVVKAHKKKTVERDTAAEKAILTKDLVAEPHEHLSDTIALDPSSLQCKTSEKSPNQTISQYINRGPIDTNPPTRKEPPQIVKTDLSTQPQVELRMTPSQHESVVSINVDKLPSNTSDHSNEAKELSVTVFSKKQGTANDLNLSSATMQQTGKLQSTSTDFGSMHVSISEDSVPVKQIEFSINGKPVSELKSIVARAGKLDVVSSMDKVEIKIPFSKDGTKLANEDTKGSTKKSQPVLNLQISANFNEPRLQKATDTSVNSGTKIVSGTSNYDSTKTQYVLKSPNVDNQGKKLQNDRTVNDTPSTIGGRKTQEESGMTKNDFSERRRVEESKIGRRGASFDSSGIDVPSKEESSKSPMNINNSNADKTSDERAPSNMIPWWSSDDAYNKIRKKENIPKALSANIVIGKNEVNINRFKTSEQILKIDPSKRESQVVESSENVNVSSRGTGIQKAGFEKTKKIPSESSSVSVIKRILEQRTQKAESVQSEINKSRVSKPTSRREGATTIPDAASKKLEDRTKEDIRARQKSPVSAEVLKKDEKSIVPSGSETNSSKNVKDSPHFIDRNINEKSQVTNVNEKVNKEQNLSPDPKKTAENQKPKQKTELVKVVPSSDAITKTEQPVTLANKPSKDGKPPNEKNSNNIPTNSKGEDPPSNKPTKKDALKKVKSTNEVTLSHTRMKEIIHSIKPIEKRKDGTLIDYGVTVPSRRKSGKRNKKVKSPLKKSSNLGIQNISPVTSTKDANKQTSPGSAERTQKVKKHENISVKRETQRPSEFEARVRCPKIASKNVGDKVPNRQRSPMPSKNVDNSEKKNTEVKNTQLTKDPRSSNPSDTNNSPKGTSSTAMVKASCEKNLDSRPLEKPMETNKSPKSIISVATKKESCEKNLDSRPLEKPMEANKPLKSIISVATKKESCEKNLDSRPPEKPMEANKPPKVIISTPMEKASSGKTLGTQPPKKPVERKQVKSLTRPEKVPFVGTIKPPQKKDFRSSAAPPVNNSPKISLMSEERFEEEKSPLEGTIVRQSTYPLNDRLFNSETKSLTGTDKHSILKKSDIRTMRIETSPSIKTIHGRTEDTSKNPSHTGIAPLEGTIGNQLPKKQTFTDRGGAEEKKIRALDIKENRSASRTHIGKISSNKGRGNPESDGSASAITGPAGLISSNPGSFMMSRILPNDNSFAFIGHATAAKQKLQDKVDKDDDKIAKSALSAGFNRTRETQNSTMCGMCLDTRKVGSVLFNNADRPEKNVLYSIWLQRFENNVDGKFP